MDGELIKPLLILIGIVVFCWWAGWSFPDFHNTFQYARSLAAHVLIWIVVLMVGLGIFALGHLVFVRQKK